MNSLFLNTKSDKSDWGRLAARYPTGTPTVVQRAWFISLEIYDTVGKSISVVLVRSIS